MVKNSWSHYKAGNILARKQIDWSMFTWGSTIPADLHNSFKLLGKTHPDRKLNRKAITLIYENQEFEVHIQKSRIKNRKDDTYQLRYDSARSLIELITNTFQVSLIYINSEREKRKKLGEKKPNVVVPSSIAEYIDFCITDDATKLEIKFHTVYDQRDDELLFQTKVMATQVIDTKIIDAPKQKKLRNTKSYLSHSRDPITAKRSLISSDYFCEFNTSHKDFTSNVTQRNYVEAHHLIPLEYHEEYEDSLDVEANIVALCPSCHRRIHLAVYDEKINLIDTLFEQRINRLLKCNLKLTKENLYRYYKKI